MNGASFAPEYERENIIIDGKPYLFTLFLSLDDCFTLIDVFDHKPGQCRQSVAEYIRTRLDVPEDQKPPTDRILAQGDDFFKGIFELLLRNDETLKKLYEVRTDDADICHRFVSALKDEFGDIPYKQILAVSIPKIQIPKIPQIPSDVLETSRIAIEQWSAISDTVTTALTNGFHAISAIAQYSNLWFENIQKSLETVYQIGGWLSDILQSVYTPELSERQKEALRASHETWGKYGWTQPLSAPDTFLDTPPADRKDANAKALKYCKNTDMEQLFTAFLDLPHVKKSDVNEAIFAFRNRQYKSCALILFTLIDARLIRLQRDEDRKGWKKRRDSGKSAAENLFKHIAEEQDIHGKTFMLFSHENIIHSLLTVFADGNDFKEQPDGINRNFLGHGMLTRKVTRKDCVQLFLLYYNLLDYLDIIYGKH